MAKQITIDQLRNVLAEEIKYATPEKVKVRYCTPVLLGGYKREGSDTFGTNVEEIVAGVSKHVNGSFTVAKTDSAYDGDFGPYTLFVDILV